MNILQKVFILIICLWVMFLSLSVSVVADNVPHSATASEFTVSPVFSDGMVLQQNEPIRIWGTSPCEGEYITAIFDGSTGSAPVTDGKWEIILAERLYSNQPKVLEVYGGPDSDYISFENIRIGDVWWVMGQSNAEFSCCADPYWSEFEASLTGSENIALFDLKKNAFSPDSHTRWRQLTRYSAHDASAIACYTAATASRLINHEIPLGMVMMAYKGHELSSFMPEEIGKKHTSNGTSGETYNSVIDPVMPMPIRGIIWYQGEADSNIYYDYSVKLSEYLTWLRDEKAQINHNFPIYCVELSPSFNDTNDPERQYIDYGNVRGETGLLASKLPNFNICVTSDLWTDRAYSNNLHPNNKSAVAYRLAFMLLSKEYGFGNNDFYFGPSLKKTEITEDCLKATLTFDHIGEGLSADSFAGFLVLGLGWEEIDAKFEIIAPDKLQITSDEKICIVKYHTDTSGVFGETIFLKNSHNIPAASFAVTFLAPDSGRTYIKYYLALAVATTGFVFIAAKVIGYKTRKKI